MGLIILDGAGGVNKANVDADGHLNVNVRPPAFGALGYYRQAVVSGTLTASLGTGLFWSCRWTDATRLCLIQSIRVNAITVTSNSVIAVQFNLNVLRSYTATDTGGTAVGVPASMQKMRSSMGSSLMGDWRMPTTGLLTAGTRTPDTNPIGMVVGTSSATVGTTWFGAGAPQPIYSRDNVDHHPIILAQNEGLAITNPATSPTGTWTFLVQMEWGEVAAY